ncbi:hypothetical protein HZ994_10920 [Akkermansiaceae bacterium]|nr:hypothetical protein HZ994_10920 [Akkermansiaceae bacterium]
MKTKLLLSLPLVGCLAIVSCYPIPDGPRKPQRPAADATVTSQDQQKIQDQRDRMKLAEEKKQAEADAIKEKPATGSTTTTDKPKADKPKGEYAFATPVPGKEGFVFSPYNNKLVDVRDIPSGTLVQDPTYPAAEKKYFRVP